MIINALYQYYQTLLQEDDSGVARPGFSRARVEHCLIISQDGNLQNIIDLRDINGQKVWAKEITVPAQQKRAGQRPPPNFMCDNCAYILGLMRKNDNDKNKVKNRFNDFIRLHETVLEGIEDKGAEAILFFLKNWNPDSGEAHPIVARHIEDLVKGGNLVFKLRDSEGYLHERKAIQEAWLNYWHGQKSEVEGQCLVTGEVSKIARLHPSIKKVAGAQSVGASIVSFDKNAFTSYGKTQSFNAPVSEEAAFGYTTALNYLLNSSRNNTKIGDTTFVFWAERSTGGMEEDLLGALFSGGQVGTNKDNEEVKDPQTEALLRDIFQRIKQGRKLAGSFSSINENTAFYILGLAPNASRLAIRFWKRDPYIKYIERIAQHYRDLNIVKSFDNEPEFIPVWRMLQETAPRRERDRIPPLLSGALMKSILTGQPYPVMMFNAILNRIRADREVNYVRASIIKAYMVRNKRFYKKESEVDLTLELNEDNRNNGYLLGRLFALLEMAQNNANPGIQSTIRDSYLSAASATPKAVFPLLLRLSQHHISKAEYGGYYDKRIEEIVSLLGGFPAHLNLDEQGQFFLGYYQQRKKLYTKKEKIVEKEGVE